ncbi:breast cancer type 1 susceptibility protein homolog [Periplaneta americana]|uniref:breast cancer type 1 susceptibility protein homolog n=1 Tax=Periplaneta americana TaxID=6978 RepID=UPI0037E7C768
MEDVAEVLDNLSDGVQLFQKSLQCAICLEVLQNPVCTRCMHTFCRECIMTVINKNRRAYCPLCNKSITRRSITENEKIKKLVEKVQHLIDAIGKDTGYDIASHMKLPSSTREAYQASPKFQKKKEEVFSIPLKTSPLKTSVPAEKTSKEEWLKRYDKQYTGKRHCEDDDVELLSISQMEPTVSIFMPPPNRKLLEIKSKVDMAKVPPVEKVQEWLHKNDEEFDNTPESQEPKTMTVTADVHKNLDDEELISVSQSKNQCYVVPTKVNMDAVIPSSEDSENVPIKNKIFTSKGTGQNSTKEEDKIDSVPSTKKTEEDPYEFISSQKLEKPPKKKRKKEKDKVPVKKANVKGQRTYRPAFKKENKKKTIEKYLVSNSDSRKSPINSDITFTCPVDINDTFDNLVANTKKPEPVKTLEIILDEESEDNELLLFRTPLEGPIIYYKPDESTTESMSDVDFSSGSDEEWNEKKESAGRKKGKNVRSGSLPARKNSEVNKEQEMRSKSSGPCTRRSRNIKESKDEEWDSLFNKDKHKMKIVQSVKQAPLSPSKKVNVNTLNNVNLKNSRKDSVVPKDVSNKLVEKVVNLTDKVHAGKENLVGKIPEKLGEANKSTSENNAILDMTLCSRSPGWSRVSQSKKEFEKFKKPVLKALNVSGGEACTFKKHGTSVSENQIPNTTDDLVSPVPTIDDADSMVSVPVVAFNSPEALKRAKMMSEIVQNLASQIEPDTSAVCIQKEMTTESVKPQCLGNAALQKFSSMNTSFSSEFTNAGDSPKTCKRRDQINTIVSSLEDNEGTEDVCNNKRDDNVNDFRKSDLERDVSNIEKDNVMNPVINNMREGRVLMIQETNSTMTSEQPIEMMETDQHNPRKEGNIASEFRDNEPVQCRTDMCAVKEYNNNIEPEGPNALTVMNDRTDGTTGVLPRNNHNAKEILVVTDSRIGSKEKLIPGTDSLTSSDIIGNSENTPHFKKNFTTTKKTIDIHQQTTCVSKNDAEPKVATDTLNYRTDETTRILQNNNQDAEENLVVIDSRIASKEKQIPGTDSLTSSDIIGNSENTPHFNKTFTTKKRTTDIHQQTTCVTKNDAETKVATDTLNDKTNETTRILQNNNQDAKENLVVIDSRIASKEKPIPGTDSLTSSDIIGNSENTPHFNKTFTTKKRTTDIHQQTRCMSKNDAKIEAKVETDIVMSDVLRNSLNTPDIEEGLSKKSCTLDTHANNLETLGVPPKDTVEGEMQLNETSSINLSSHSKTVHVPFIKYGYFRPLKRSVKFMFLGPLAPQKADTSHDTFQTNDIIHTFNARIDTSRESPSHTIGIQTSPKLLNPLSHISSVTDAKIQTTPTANPQFVQFVTPKFSAEDTQENTETFVPDSCDSMYAFPTAIPLPRSSLKSHKYNKEEECLMSPICEMMEPLHEDKLPDSDNVYLNEPMVLNGCANSKETDYNYHGVPYSQFSTATTIKNPYLVSSGNSPEFSSNSGTVSGLSVSLLTESDTRKKNDNVHNQTDGLKNQSVEATSANIKLGTIEQNEIDESTQEEIDESTQEKISEQDAKDLHSESIQNKEDDSSDSFTEKTSRRSSKVSRQLKFSPRFVPKLSDPALDINMDDDAIDKKELCRNSLKRSRTESISDSATSDNDSKNIASSEEREMKKPCHISLKEELQQNKEHEISQKVVNNEEEDEESLAVETEVINLLTPPEDSTEINQEQKWLGEEVPDSEELMARVMANIDADLAATRERRKREEQEKRECMVIEEDERRESPTLFTPPSVFPESEEQNNKMTCELVESETEVVTGKGSMKEDLLGNTTTVASGTEILDTQQKEEMQVVINKLENEISEHRTELDEVMECEYGDDSKHKASHRDSENESEDDDFVEPTPQKDVSNKTWDSKKKEEDKECAYFQHVGQEYTAVTQTREQRPTSIKTDTNNALPGTSPLVKDSTEQQSKKTDTPKLNSAVESVVTPSSHSKQFVLRLPQTTPSTPVNRDQGVVTPRAIAKPIEKPNSNALKPMLSKDKLTCADISPLTRVSAGQVGTTPINKPSTKLCFVCSGLPAALIARVKALSRMMGAEFSNKFEPHTTHLVVKASDDMMADKTLKYLSAVAKGIWVVSFAWVNACLQARKLLPEDEYEMLDTSGEEGPHKSRISSSPLLTNFQFCCIEPFSDLTKDQLEGILQECGASVVSSPDKFSSKGKHCMIVIQINAERMEECKEWWERYGVLPIGHEWVFECIGRYRIMPIWSFLMCPVSEEAIRSLGLPEDVLASDDETEVESEA